VTPTLSPKQVESFAGSSARVNLWEGSVRSGKTFISLLRWAEDVARGERGPRLMIGKTERTLKRNVLDPLTELLGYRAVRFSIGQGEARILGHPVYVVGANDERAELKIRGMTLLRAYGDEVSTWPASFFRMLLSRLSLPGAALFGTTNPDSPYHWLQSDYLAKEGLDLRVFPFRLEDNPSLEPAFIESLKVEYGPPGSLWYRRFIEGAWVAAEGAIYDMLDTTRHVIDLVPETRNAIGRAIGVDYGTTNPFHAVVAEVRVDPDGLERIYVTRELRYETGAGAPQRTDSEHSDALRAWVVGLPYDRLYVDPSAASFVSQLWRDGWHGITNADNAVLDGIRVVSTLLTMDRLRIARDCNHLIRELTGYAWDPAAQARGEDKPLKRHDHGPDALRYLVMGMRRYWRRWVRWEPIRRASDAGS
jgi:PBSX family phage terminase large subunit